jgi:molybdenum cofactor cytidylyltransferase
MDNTNQVRVAGMILAAGEGKRFGGPKALAKYRNETFLEMIARNLWGAADSITVIGGASFDQVKMEADRLGLPIIENKDWADGQFTSLKAGLKAISNQFDCLLIALVDHPFVKKGTYLALKSRYIEFPERIIIPIHDSRRGHPIILPAALSSTILKSANNSNLREILREFALDVIECPVEDEGILRDIDTRGNLEDKKWA